MSFWWFCRTHNSAWYFLCKSSPILFCRIKITCFGLNNIWFVDSHYLCFTRLRGRSTSLNNTFPEFCFCWIISGAENRAKEKVSSLGSVISVTVFHHKASQCYNWFIIFNLIFFDILSCRIINALASLCPVSCVESLPPMCEPFQRNFRH